MLTIKYPTIVLPHSFTLFHTLPHSSTLFHTLPHSFTLFHTLFTLFQRHGNSTKRGGRMGPQLYRHQRYATFGGLEIVASVGSQHPPSNHHVRRSIDEQPFAKKQRTSSCSQRLIRLLLDYYLATTWRLLGYYSTTTRLLLDYYSTITMYTVTTVLTHTTLLLYTPIRLYSYTPILLYSYTPILLYSYTPILLSDSTPLRLYDCLPRHHATQDLHHARGIWVVRRHSPRHHCGGKPQCRLPTRTTWYDERRHEHETKPRFKPEPKRSKNRVRVVSFFLFFLFFSLYV